MLQLPTSTHGNPGRFTKANLADITRNGKVVVRDISKKPDPVIRRIAAFKKAVQASNKTEAGLLRVKGRLEKQHALDWSLRVDCVDCRPLIPLHTTFYSIDGIEKAAKRARSICRQVIANERRLLKERKDESAYTRSERKGLIERERQRLRDLPAIVSRLRRDFIKNQSRVRGCQRREKYLTFARINARARNRVHHAYQAVIESEVRTAAGAAALIEFAGYVLNSHAVQYRGDIPELLRRVSKFVSVKS